MYNHLEFTDEILEWYRCPYSFKTGFYVPEGEALPNNLVDRKNYKPFTVWEENTDRANKN